MFLSDFSLPTRDRRRSFPATAFQSCHYPAMSLSFGSFFPRSFYLAYPPSTTTHCSSRTLSQGDYAFPFPQFILPGVSAERDKTQFVQEPFRSLRLSFSLVFFGFFLSGVTLDSLVCFFCFLSPRSLRIGCTSVFVRIFLPLNVTPARPQRTFGYIVGCPFSARGFRRFPFCCYGILQLLPDPFTFFQFL